MKFCLTSRQNDKYLSKADEIKVDYRDRKIIIDYATKYPNATFILRHSAIINEDIDWKEIENYNILTQGKFIFCSDAINLLLIAKEKNIKFYHPYVIKSFYELNALKNLGVCYIMVDAPLFFNLEEVNKFGIPVRAIPNLANLDGLPREDNVCGTWIRPEDLDLYAQYISVIEFEDNEMNYEQFYYKEQALFRIYAEEKNYPGDLEMIVSDLNYSGINRMIPPELAERRLVCGQMCQKNGKCKACYRMLNLANPERLEKYQNEINTL